MLLSLRARLILPLSVASLVVVGALAWDYYMNREHHVAAAQEDLLSQTKLIAARQQAITSHADAILNGLMLSPNLRGGASSEACSGELAQRQKQEAQFSNIIKSLPNGDLVCSAQPMTGAINVADRDYFQEALQRREMVVSGVITGRIEGKASVAFGKATHDETGRVAGVLILTLDLDWLNRELAQAGLPAGTRLVVVDAEGNVVARFPAQGAWIGASVAETELFQRIRAAEAAGAVEGHDLYGERRLFAHAPLLEKTVAGPMYIWQSVPMASVTAPAQRDSLIKLGVAAGALLAAMGLLIWGANRFLVRPVRILARTAERLSTEGAGACSGLPHDDTELGKLAQALDGATSAIAEREQRLMASEQRFRRLNELSSDWIWERDEELCTTYISPSYFEITSARPEGIMGTKPGELRNLDGSDEASYRAYLAAMAEHRPFRDYEYARQDPDGEVRWRTMSGVPVFDAAGAFRGYHGTGRDITERRRYEEELRRQATTDALTGLPNRTLLRDRLEHAVERAARAERSVAVLLLDLDEFKQVNDGLGHSAGDALLRLAAQRLRSCVGLEDTVARFGGDEFVVVLEDLVGEEMIQEVASRMRDALAESTEIEGRDLVMEASIGVAVFPRDGEDAVTLLGRADAAMYQAKRAGGGGLHFYTQDLNERAACYVTLRAELQGALERGEFELHFQPIFDCGGGEIVGAEALLRWRRFGVLVAPGEFLEVAEDSGMIVPIGAWVLREACALAQAWRGGARTGPYVSVNLSARQFRQGSLADMVRTVIADTGLAPERLVLELTETTMMSDLDAAAEVLGRIEALGVRVAIDDFGTGHSSLAYLKRLPVSKLKIDRCFVQDAVTDADDASIVRAVIELAHALGMGVVAEGVETSEQVALLRRLGCDRMQGYLLGRPMPVSEFEALLDA